MGRFVTKFFDYFVRKKLNLGEYRSFRIKLILISLFIDTYFQFVFFFYYIKFVYISLKNRFFFEFFYCFHDYFYRFHCIDENDFSLYQNQKYFTSIEISWSSLTHKPQSRKETSEEASRREKKNTTRKQILE